MLKAAVKAPEAEGVQEPGSLRRKLGRAGMVDKRVRAGAAGGQLTRSLVPGERWGYPRAPHVVRGDSSAKSVRRWAPRIGKDGNGPPGRCRRREVGSWPGGQRKANTTARCW